MYTNILVTGAKGFIGSNVVKRLKKIKNINLIEFNRDSSWGELENNISTIDFIFHFAGEVRPKSSDEEFEKSNVTLTRNLINLIEKKGKKIPFLMASSIHAKLQKNSYGRTKREAEICLEEYYKRNNIPIWIYRLPHLFGEGCKANHNSVISTWIHNSIEGKDIVVYDRDISITYVYIQDIVDEFIACLNCPPNRSIYLDPKTVYDTTLGDVIDYILEFKRNTYSDCTDIDVFKEKLCVTYQYYVKQDKGKLCK